MSRAEKLIEETHNLTSVWMNFNSIRKKHIRKQKLYIYCFYEGIDDSKYFNHRLESLGLNGLYHFECKGKLNVLAMREIILEKNNSQQYKISSLFFIDKDYDEIINNDKYISWKNEKDIYVTPCYSIENCFSTKKVFKRILQSEFNLKETDILYKKLLKLFIQRQKEFHDIILEVNTWIATYKYFYDKKEISEKINYQDLNLKKIINFSFNSISKKLDIDNFFNSKIGNLPEKFLEKKEELKTKLKNNTNCNLRGKFEIDFLYLFINEINNDTNDYKKLSFHIQQKNLISNLSQYAITPKYLKKYIKKAIHI